MKRGVLLVFLVVLCSLTVSAHEINLSILNNEIGAGQPLQGNIKIKLTDPAELNSNIEVYVDGEISGSYPLKELIKEKSYNTIPPLYKKSGNSLISNEFVFPSAGKHVLGIDVTQGIYDVREIGEAFRLSFDMEGKPHEGQHPTSVQVNIGDNDLTEFTYTGPPKNNLINLSSDYINYNAPSIDKFVNDQNNMFCQEIEIEPSFRYSIGTVVKRNSLNATLYGAILDTPFYNPMGLNNCVAENKCCEIQEIGDVMTRRSCSYNLDIDTKQPGYLCVFALSDSRDDIWFTIKADTDSSVKKGYMYGSQSPVDYYITGSYRDYERELKETVRFETQEEELLEIYSSIAGCISGKDCIIPVAVSSLTKGIVKISNLHLDIDVGGRGIISNFYDLVMSSESVSYDGVLNLDLIKTMAVSPERTGRPYNVYVSLEGSRSNSIEFTAVQLPEPNIKVSSDTADVDEEILFDARNAESPHGDDLIEFKWYFGDGNQGSGKASVHKYSNSGKYFVLASVKDSEGRTGYETKLITVRGNTTAPKNFNERLEKVVNDIESLISGIGSWDSDIVETFGYSDVLNSAHSQLSGLKGNNTNVTESEMEIRMNRILESVPVDVESRTVSFDAKIKSLDKIPDHSALFLEDQIGFKRKLFLAQKNAVVNSEAKIAETEFFDGTKKNYVVIKKTVSGGDVYELIPAGVNVLEVLTPGHSEIGNYLKFSSVSEIKYIVDTSDMMLVSKIKSIVVPADLSIYKEDEFSGEDMFNCGDKVCATGFEDKVSCPEDCSEKFPWLIIILLIIVVSGGLYYIYMYKGPGSLESFGQPVFRNKKDEEAVKKYVKRSLSNKVTKQKIIMELKKKGWNEKQIKKGFQ